VFYERREGKNAILRWSCTCDYMGAQGIANGAICTHVMGAFYRKALEKLVEKDDNNRGTKARTSQVGEARKVS